jgi:phage gp29-like protein
LTKLLNSDFATYDKHLTEQLIAPLYVANFDTLIPAGRLETIVEEVDMSDTKAETFSKVASAVKSFVDAGVSVETINEFATNLGIDFEIKAAKRRSPLSVTPQSIQSNSKKRAK